MLKKPVCVQIRYIPVCDRHSYVCGLEEDTLNCSSTSGEGRWMGELERVGVVKEALTFYSIIPLYCLNIF